MVLTLYILKIRNLFRKNKLHFFLIKGLTVIKFYGLKGRFLCQNSRFYSFRFRVIVYINIYIQNSKLNTYFQLSKNSTYRKKKNKEKKMYNLTGINIFYI